MIVRILEHELTSEWITPSENQGQIVDISFSCTENYIL